MIKNLVVHQEYYSIPFTKVGEKWVLEWSENEFAFHQKMMNEVMKLNEEEERNDASAKRDLSGN